MIGGAGLTGFLIGVHHVVHKTWLDLPWFFLGIMYIYNMNKLLHDRLIL
jgi:hypothetical protein